MKTVITAVCFRRNGEKIKPRTILELEDAEADRLVAARYANYHSAIPAKGRSKRRDMRAE